MWLAWDTAAVIAVGLVVLSVAIRPLRRRGLTILADVAKETAVVLGLYAVWQWAGDLAFTQIKGAIAHGHSVWHVERVLHLPSEQSIQRLVLPHPVVVEALNRFYEGVHVPALVVFLIWLYVRHRDRYPYWRNVGAVLTGVCLLIETVPVAPPRLMADLGFVDTALRYGQSVYGPHGISIAPQLAAMPSVHVAWAVLIAVAVIDAGTGRWRWLIIAHPVLTTLAVVATANHWWLDGIVAAALLAPAALAVRGATTIAHRFRVRAIIASAQLRSPETDPNQGGLGRGPDRMPVV
jgi:hypothetical protein